MMRHIIKYANYYLHKYWSENYSLEFCYEDFYKAIVVAVMTGVSVYFWFDMKSKKKNDTGSQTFAMVQSTSTAVMSPVKVAVVQNSRDLTIPPRAADHVMKNKISTVMEKRIDTTENDIIFQIHRSARLSGDEAEGNQCITLLMKRPDAINSVLGKYKFTPFLCACWAGNLNLQRYMLENGANINSRTKDGDGAIYLAARAEMVINKTPRFTSLQLLLNHGADVNAQNLSGSTALHLASGIGNIRVVKWLLDHGASPYKTNQKGQRPIDVAKADGHTSVVKLLDSCCPIENSSDDSSSSCSTIMTRAAELKKRLPLKGILKRSSSSQENINNNNKAICLNTSSGPYPHMTQPFTGYPHGNMVALCFLQQDPRFVRQMGYQSVLQIQDPNTAYHQMMGYDVTRQGHVMAESRQSSVSFQKDMTVQQPNPRQTDKTKEQTISRDPRKARQH